MKCKKIYYSNLMSRARWRGSVRAFPAFLSPREKHALLIAASAISVAMSKTSYLTRIIT